jgi:PPOX class probable F420-dependent enzyme
MDFDEVLPFLKENHTAVVATITSSGSAQATVVSAGLFQGQIAFVSRGNTMKVKNALQRGRATVTVLRPTDNRYVTIEGPALVHGWGNTSRPDLLLLLRKVYTTTGRPPDRWEDFDGAMEKEQRTVVLVSPQRVYGSL